MNLELALETLRDKSLPYKSLFDGEVLLTGVFEFDAVLGGFSKTKTYLIVGQYGCCPLFLTNTLIGNMAFFNKMAFREIAKNIKPKLLKSKKQRMLNLNDLDERLVDHFDVIIAMYRPANFGIEIFEDQTSTEHTLEFKVLKGAKGIHKYGKLYVNLHHKTIYSRTLCSWMYSVERRNKKDNLNSFECLLSAFIKQENFIKLSPEFQLYFKDKIEINSTSVNLEDYQIVFTNEPNPKLIGYCLIAEQRDFIESLKPEFYLQSVSLDNILNLLTLFSNTQDYNQYYKQVHRQHVTSVIGEHLKKTNVWILYTNQLAFILKSYTDLTEDQVPNMITHIIENNAEDLTQLNEIILENGLGLIDQINQLLLPSRQMYDPKLLLAQKIYNYLRVNEL